MEISSQNYEKLLTKIRQTISKTQKNIVESVDYQKVLMSWKIGKEIDLHLRGQDKAEYGEKIFLQLTADTQIEQTTLYQMRAFYKNYSKMPTQKNSLSWSHYRSLIAVKDAETRQQLENLVIEKSLGSDRLQKEIEAVKKHKKIVKKSSEEIPQLKVKRGKLFTYSLNEEGEIDLGFNIFLEKKSVALQKTKPEFTKSDYTYIAKLERIVDGDTLHVKLDLGFGVKHHEILRLAKINAAESATPEGKKATAFLKEALNEIEFLVVKTNKTDIYGRYVADVFFDESGKEKDLQKIAVSGTYLNQLLLNNKVVELWQ
jgi:endonuclease YncB( thermonuclease family)